MDTSLGLFAQASNSAKTTPSGVIDPTATSGTATRATAMAQATAIPSPNVGPSPGQSPSLGTTSPAVGNPPTAKQAYDANETILKFQQELSVEARAHREYLKSLLSDLKWICGILGTFILFCFSILGIKSWKSFMSEMDRRFRNGLDDKVAELVNKKVDDLITRHDHRFERTRKKLYKGIQTINNALIKTNPEMVEELSCGLIRVREIIEGKRILWVDDDEPGVDLYAQLVKWCGPTTDFAQTTSGAVEKFKKVHFDLIVTNMRRDDDPCEYPAGIALAKEIRKLSEKVSIIIFTRPEHKYEFEKKAADVGVNTVADNPDELMKAIRKCLVPIQESAEIKA